jgi:hypothetical protein
VSLRAHSLAILVGAISERAEVLSIKRRRTDLSKALHIEEHARYQKLYTALRKMKDQKPELFNIKLHEQIGKLTAELSVRAPLLLA